MRLWSPPPREEQPAWAAADKSGTLTMKEAMQYVLSLPVSTVIIGCDTVAQLEENVRIAAEFTPLSEAQLAALTVRTAGIARQALFFRQVRAP